MNAHFYSTVVKLISTGAGTLPATQGRLAHAVFLDIIQAVEPDLAQQLHAKNQRRPFTVSPLWGLGRARGGEMTIKPNQEVSLRFTLLGDALFAALLRHFVEVGRLTAIRLHALEFQITDILAAPGSHLWAGYNTADELWRQAQPNQRKIILDLESPTVFSRSSKNGLGKFMEPFPSPPMLFGSLAAKWNAHVPHRLDKKAIRDYAEETVVVGEYKLESRMFRYWGQPQIGTTGRVTYRLKDKRNPEMNHLLNLLADFAFYGGVGYKTTMGMGQVRRV